MATGELRFDVIGTSLTLSLNGTVIASATDGVITAAGGVGLRCFGTSTVDSYAASLPLPPVTATLPFSDDFNRADSTYISGYWTERSGDFQVVGNASTSRSPTVSLMTVNGISAADVSVQANISLAPSIASSGLSVAGLVARYSGPGDSNMYVASLIRDSAGITGQIYRNVGGTWTRLAIGNTTSTTGVLQFDVVGTSLTLSLNGTVIAAATDGVITAAGGVGLRCFGTSTVDSYAASTPV
jgi:hypothetical protein